MLREEKQYRNRNWNELNEMKEKYPMFLYAIESCSVAVYKTHTEKDRITEWTRWTINNKIEIG